MCFSNQQHLYFLRYLMINVSLFSLVIIRIINRENLIFNDWINPDSYGAAWYFFIFISFLINIIILQTKQELPKDHIFIHDKQNKELKQRYNRYSTIKKYILFSIVFALVFFDIASVDLFKKVNHISSLEQMNPSSLMWDGMKIPYSFTPAYRQKFDKTSQYFTGSYADYYLVDRLELSDIQSQSGVYTTKGRTKRRKGWLQALSAITNGAGPITNSYLTYEETISIKNTIVISEDLQIRNIYERAKDNFFGELHKSRCLRTLDQFERNGYYSILPSSKTKYYIFFRNVDDSYCKQKSFAWLFLFVAFCLFAVSSQLVWK